MLVVPRLLRSDDAAKHSGRVSEKPERLITTNEIQTRTRSYHPHRTRGRTNDTQMSNTMAPMGSYESTVEQVEELMRGPANPLNGSQFSQEYFRLLADRNQLPVAQYRGQLLDLIQKHHVLVITSGTGSGKTTQIPMFLALAHGIDDLEKEKKRFTVAQPRRIATVNVCN